MARIAVFSVPAYGHLNPVLPIVRELVRRGHRVTVFNEQSFEQLIAPTGAEFAAYPPVIHLEDFSRSLKDGDMIAWIEMIMGATGPIADSGYKALRRDPHDLIVFDGVAVWGEMLARRLRLPSVSISTTFMSEAIPRTAAEIARDTLSIFTHLPGFIVGFFKLVASRGVAIPWGLPLIPRQGTETLMLTSKAFHPPSRRRDEPQFVFVGCSIAPDTRREDFDFSRLDGRPLLYISLGTLHHGNSAFFETCIEAFAGNGMQVLVSVGRGTDLGRYASAPSNFIFAEAVPQLAVLERAHVFLTHGGLNSVHEGLWHGVPMVAVPQQIEQLHNAEAMQAAGAGLVVDTKAKGGRITAATLRGAVERIEAGHAGFAAAAARMGETLRAGGGYLAAADRIEGVARSRSSVVHDGSGKPSPSGA